MCTLDVVQRVAELPAPGEKVQSTAVEVCAGGPATNAALAAAALGADVRLLTALGAHPLTALIRSDLSAGAVELLDVDPDLDAPPPLSAVAVRESDGERTVVARNAASAAPPITQAQLDAALAGASAVLLDGHHPDLALAVARTARRRGVPVVLDAGSWKPVLVELLPLVDVAACSAQFRTPAGGDPLDDVAALGVPTVVVTAGAGPVRWRGPDGAGSVAAEPVTARDTLGAGDVWHGAFTAALAGGVATTPGRIAFANTVAAQRIMRIGATRWRAALRDLKTPWRR